MDNQNNYPQNLNTPTPAFSPTPPTAQPILTTQPASPYPFNQTQPAQNPSKDTTKDTGKIILIVTVVIFILATLTFLALFIWKNHQYQEASTNLKGKIDTAVANAIHENSEKLEADFEKREKYPKKRFAGPVDYGSLSFEYPKTWSLYVHKDASHGGDFEAYLNKDQVATVSPETINSLRVYIKNRPFEVVAKEYEQKIKQKKITLSVENINNETANIYTGEVSNKIIGKSAVFRLRDKTVIIQTDANLFINDFQEILKTVVFNK